MRKLSGDQRTDYYGAWKVALGRYFEPFLRLCFPAVHAGIDWSHDPIPLDQELQEVVRDAESGKHRVNKLFQVRRHDGMQDWILVHVEVQSHPDRRLPRRLYRYYSKEDIQELFRLIDWLVQLPAEQEVDQASTTLGNGVPATIGAAESAHPKTTHQQPLTSAIIVSGGKSNRIIGCTMRALGRSAVAINGGEDHGVISSDIYHVGQGGVSLRGGDRPSLTPAGHSVRNCDVHRYNRWIQHYNPAVGVGGVGNRVEHSHLHQARRTMDFGSGCAGLRNMPANLSLRGADRVCRAVFRNRRGCRHRRFPGRGT